MTPLVGDATAVDSAASMVLGSPMNSIVGYAEMNPPAEEEG